MRGVLVEQILPSLINCTLEQGAYITRRWFHKANSLRSFIIYERLAAEFEGMTPRCWNKSGVRHTERLLNNLIWCKRGRRPCQSFLLCTAKLHSSRLTESEGYCQIVGKPTPQSNSDWIWLHPLSQTALCSKHAAALNSNNPRGLLSVWQ